MRLKIRHATVYRYSEAVHFGPHRLMIRPREEHDRAIESSMLEIFPPHQLRWQSDVYGNSVAVVNFLQPSETLRIVSEVVVKQFEPNPFNFILDPRVVDYPFAYDDEELPELEPFRAKLYPQDTEAMVEWLAPHWPGHGSRPTIDLLLGLNQAINTGMQYVRREEMGVQSPGETLQLGSGSCRDYAVFLIEACRHLGLAARFVSGYVHTSDEHSSTHAWTEIYLPGAGWKGFDPTSGILASDLHVPVAVSRHPGGASPISGSHSSRSAFIDLDVAVKIEELP